VEGHRLMNPTEILKKEHRIIEVMLDCLGKVTDRISEGEKLDCKEICEMVEFFKGFADRFHHAKEEVLLFPSLESHGMPREGGPTGVMFVEHEIGRQLVREMESSVAAGLKGETGSESCFVRAARDYELLLREHIQKEDHCLFAMAESSLDAEEKLRLVKAFRAEEGKLGSAMSVHYYLEKVRELSAQFGVPFPEEEGRSESSCGCCDPGGCRGF
jgi:hemerythrin-like domain-containing protein